MFRKQLITLLREKGPLGVQALARELGCKNREVEEELEHIFRSIKREGLKMEITPAECRKCGFN